jgi:ribulose-phosphate 3-epimerase
MMITQHPLKIAPSILAADFGHLADEVRTAEQGGADYIHLDIMDGRFVPNISFGPMIVAAVRQVTELPLDVHLMIEEPERYVEAFVEAGANILTVHAEACVHLHRTVQRITELGCRAGVALNPSTPIEAAREILPFVDMILIMTVNPGFGAQRFIETSTSKMRRMRKMQAELNPICELEVDGGIYASNIDDVVRNGANVIVVGTAVFNGQATAKENIAELRRAAGGAIWRQA